MYFKLAITGNTNKTGLSSVFLLNINIFLSSFEGSAAQKDLHALKVKEIEHKFFGLI